MKSAKTSPQSKSKHQLKTEATLRDLLVAAETIFVRDGFEKAQIESIAAEAGRTKGAVYTHFKSKEDIFFAVLETKAQSRLDAFLRSARDLPFEQRVEVIKELFLNTVEEENWPILILEFKVFALRKKASLKRIRDLYQLLYDDVSRDLLSQKIAGQKRKALISLAVLRSLPSAIALERQFNPIMNSPSSTRQVLETIFEALVRMNRPGPLKTGRTAKHPPSKHSAKPVRIES